MDFSNTAVPSSRGEVRPFGRCSCVCTAFWAMLICLIVDIYTQGSQLERLVRLCHTPAASEASCAYFNIIQL